MSNCYKVNFIRFSRNLFLPVVTAHVSKPRVKASVCGFKTTDQVLSIVEHLAGSRGNMKKNTRSTVFGFFTSILVLSGLFFSCSSSQKRESANTLPKPKHYIMTLHGIRGNDVSFGDFHNLIKTHLEKIDPGYEVVPLNLTYTIADVNYTPEKAGREIQAKLAKIVPVLNPIDQISVVAYSMGGQVGLAWYFEALKDPTAKIYADQVTHFIGLGAAYWGAKEAGLATSDIQILKATLKHISAEIRNLIRENSSRYLWDSITNTVIWLQGKTDAQINTTLDKLQTIEQIKKFYDENIRTLSAVKISFNEFVGLSLGGVPETNLRIGLLSQVGNKKNSVKWTTIAPLVQCFESNAGAKTEGCDDFQNPVFKFINESINRPYTFGYKRRETDNAVITPSGNAQFIAVVDSNENYVDGQITPISSSKYVILPANHKVYFTEASHATVVSAGQYDKAIINLNKLGDSWTRLALDVVLVYNSNCTDNNKCATHPSYKYVLNALADCDRVNSTCDSNDKTLNTIFNKDTVRTAQDKLASEMHGFTVELNLRLPKGYDISKFDEKNILNHIQFETEKINETKYLKSSLNSETKIAIAREKEVASILIKKMTDYKDQDQLKVVLTGLFIPNEDSKYNYRALENGTAISFKIDLPGIKSRLINTIVRPYHSTFLDLKMSPQ